MANSVWYSQLFENTYGGGVLLALPYEALADWKGAGDKYDELIEEIEQFVCQPLGRTAGLFVTDDDGIHEAHWMRFPDQPGVILVVWIEWDDPSRPTLPDDMQQIARAWEQRTDPRQTWIEQQLQRTDLDWEQHDTVQPVASGVLLLVHAESRPLKARFTRPRAVAQCGDVVPVGLAPGDYRIETTFLSELPDGAHACLVCRWSPA